MRERRARASQQQTQIDRQEQIILSLRAQLNDKAARRQPPHELEQENASLRELVLLMQEKLEGAA